MKILVTGAFGYLGGRVSQFLLTETLNEVFFATSKSKNITDYQSNANVIKINWDDDNTIENACNEIDIIIHTAGMNAQDCINDPEKALKVNGLFTAKLVRFAILKNVKKYKPDYILIFPWNLKNEIKKPLSFEIKYLAFFKFSSCKAKLLLLFILGVLLLKFFENLKSLLLGIGRFF